MKKILLLLSAISFLTAQIFAQDATISIPDMTATPGTEVLVPLNITALNNVGSASIRVQYDTDVLTYIGIENDSFNGAIDNASGGELRTSWFSLSPINLSGKVYDIRFQYHGGASDLIFSLVQITNDLSQPYNIAFVSGSIGGAVSSLELTAPNGSEEWMAGTSQNITWTSSGVTNVMIEYSTDTGISWNTVVSSTASDGSYSWTVPDTPTSDALVFISDASNITLNDQSDLSFTIVAAPVPPVVGDIPDQTILEGGSFAAIPLDDYVTDGDNDKDELVWESSGEVELIVSIDANRIATITTPDPGWNGSETITFTVTDPDDLSDSDNATFTVTAVNNPPVVDGIPDQTIAEGESFATINLDDYITDPDNAANEMTWAATGQTELSVTITDRVATIGIPDELWNGSETITFTATDPGGLSDGDDAMFTVTAVNSPPVVDDIPDQSIENGSFATINLDDYVTDLDNAASEMTWEATGQVELSVSITDRVATISIPNDDWQGSETITFTATDPGGLSDNDDASFTRIVVGVDDELEIPKEFALNQNYPNPFNPSTTISYALKVTSEVTLIVYNMVGQEVASLVNENKSAGTYNVNFDASDISTGIYFYSMSAIGNDGSKFINTRKMILMK